MPTLSPSRVRRFCSRVLSRVYVRVILNALKKVNLINLLDFLLPSYVNKYSTFVEWDIEKLEIDPKIIVRPTHNNIYLARKQLQSGDWANYPNPFNSNLAIVLQGPIISENQITLRILKHYMTKHPQIKIVLSTWKETDSRELAPFLELSNSNKIKLVLNDEPFGPGVFNINRQIVSSLNGLRSLDDEFEFAIKSRTDQVFTDSRFLSQLKILFDAYEKNKVNESRIVISSLNTFAFRLYGASDMFQFGRTSDLLRFWDQPLDTSTIEEATRESATLESEAKKRVAEVYLNTNYFKLVNSQNPKFTFDESLHFLTQSFIIADAESLGHRWLKNTNLRNRWRVAKFPNKFYEFTHTDWLGCQKDFGEWLPLAGCITLEPFFSDK